MAGNELVVGEPRLGWFIDGNPDTDEIAVMLRDTGSAIELMIPLKGMFGEGDPYGRWWSSAFHFGDDPDRNRHSYKPPRVLLLHDRHGPVVLVGCRSAGSSSNFRIGQGRIVANYAVLGGGTLKYEKINGLRAEVPALAAWTRLSNMEVRVETSNQNRVRAVQMKLTNAEPVPLARPLNLVMRSTWRTEQPLGSFLAYEGVKLETAVRDARSWDEHLNIHSAVLDLVSIAAWRPFGFSTIEVRRADDPTRTMDGNIIGERWSQVETHRLPKHEEWVKEPLFLFPYDEVGPRGVARWLRLRKVYGRVIGPLLSILRSDDRWSHSNVVQSGIALEALGYLIAVEKNGGANLNSRKQMNFKPGLQVILNDMRLKPFDDLDGWIGRADTAYMGLKHLDRPEPDSLVMLNALRENLLILRFWIALQLGVKPKSLKDALGSDPLANEFVLVD